MAAPPEVTIKDLSGKWVMNKTLSDDVDPVLALQGVPWLKRRAIAWATVTLSVNQYTSPADELTHIDIESTATGGIKGTTENRTLDWNEKSHEDNLFGVVTGRNRWVEDLSKAESGSGGALDGYLTEGWKDGEGDHVQGYAVSNGAGWVAEMIWGFALVDGQRYHVRRVLVTKDSKVLRVRMVYDWQAKS